ncbi:MAG: hypothetical protein IKU57_02885 [Oscillospiraceae bacterium]|nr:hypothetical protein [Oscillospiraceae bacterium]
MFCSKCGAENHEENLFCCKCGQSLQSVPASNSTLTPNYHAAADKQLRSANTLNTLALCLSTIFSLAPFLLVAFSYLSEPPELSLIIFYVVFFFFSCTPHFIFLLMGRKICKTDNKAKVLKIAKLYRLLAILNACFAWILSILFIAVTCCGPGLFYIAASILQTVAGVKFVSGVKLHIDAV